MSHYFDSGMSVREQAWHGLMTVAEEYPRDWAEARKLAGLEWDPIKVPAFKFDGIDAEGNRTADPAIAVAGECVPDEGFSRIARSDNLKTLASGRDSYELITHTDMGMVVETVLEDRAWQIETMGAIDEGRGVWALMLLDEPITVEGRWGKDNSLTLPYMSLLNRHDRGGSLTGSATSIRIVCANTWRASEIEGQRAGTNFAIRHTKNWRDRIPEVRDAMQGARKDHIRYCEQASHLLGIRVTPEATEAFLEAVLPEPPVGLRSDLVKKNIEEARKSVRGILASETTRDVAHTAFGLVQAWGEYADHVRKYRTWETKLNRSLLNPEPAKARAVKIVKQLIPA